MAVRELISIAEAHAEMSRLQPRLRPLRVPVMAAAGRTLAENVTASLALPPFDRAAMDGYAVRSAETGPGALLPVAGTVAAGDAPARLPPGQAMRILTGAPLPEGADAVIEQESVERPQDGFVRLRRAVRPDWNVMRRAHELGQGEVAVAVGTRLTPYHLALAASLGKTHLLVWRRPRIAVIETGSELDAPGSPLRPGHIYASQAALFGPLIAEFGGRLAGRWRVGDDFGTVVQALHQAASQADAVLVTGGVSVGDYDYVPRALEQAGTLRFWRVAMHPGRAVAFGQVGETPVLALSGNPGAAVTSWLVLGARWWAHWHRGQWVERWSKAPLLGGFTKPSRETRLVRVRRVDGGVTADLDQGADVVTAYLAADGFAVIPAGSGPVPPDQVTAVWEPGGMGGREPRWEGRSGPADDASPWSTATRPGTTAGANLTK